MRIELTVESDESYVVLLDDSLMSSLDFHSAQDLERAASDGTLVFAQDGSIRRDFEDDCVCLLYVRETPDPTLTGRVITIRNASLEVPTGNLTFVPVEQIQATDAARSGPLIAGLRPGRYNATVWELSWPGAASAIRKLQLESAGRSAWLASIAVGLLAPLVAIYFLLAAPIVFAARSLDDGISSAAESVAWMLAIGLPIAFIITILWPVSKRADLAWKAARRQFPDVVIHLAERKD